MKKNYLTVVFAMKKRVLLITLTILAFFLTSSSSFAQATIKGVVQSPTGEGLTATTITEKKSGTTVVSNNNGGFSITAGTDGILEISHVGYKSQDIDVAGRLFITIVLEPVANTLNDVVVVGYGSQKKSSLTGAVSSVNMDDLDKRKVPDVLQALQGQVPGVQVTQSTGAPGDPISIVIRGVGTINSSSDPLYVIDGTPTTDITFLNPSDISSMTVLKDAAAAALYGSRASGGVIVITTKSGKKGRSNINIDYFHGIQQVVNLPTMLNTTQYLNKMEESWNNAGYSGTNPYTAEKSRTDLANTDWLHELFTAGQTDNIQVSANGGSEKVQFYLSGGYYHQNGIVVYDNDQYNRLTFRSNINANLSDRLKAGSNLQIVNSTQDALSSSGDAPGIIRHAFIRPPVISVYKDPSDPTYSASDPFTDLPFYNQNLIANGGKWNSADNIYEFSSNPIALAYFTNDKRGSFRTFGNIFGEYSFLKDKELKFKSNLGVDINFIHNKTFNQNFGDDDGGGGTLYAGMGRQNRPNSLSEERAQQSTITWSNTATYNKRFNLHSINILAGTEYITYFSSGVSGSRINFSNADPAFQYLDFGNTQTGVWNGGSAQEWALFSVFGGINYNYNNRYFLSANLRRDASSQFAEEHQVGYFPSFSAAWRISEENFMKNVKSISDLKLRASWGQLGNQSGLGNYNSLAIYDAQGTLQRLGNPDLKWETTTQTDIGLDAGFVQNKLNFSFDYFNKVTSDLLLPLSLPGFVGNLQPTVVNSGKVTNTGFELAVGYKNYDHAFKYSINANYSNVNNTVNALNPVLPNIYGDVTKTEPGHPLNSYYGLQMIGIYQNQQEIDSYLTGAPHDNIKPGYIKFKDVDGNGIINDKDRVYLGNPTPRSIYGLNLSATYKAFDISLFIQGVSGVERWNDLKRIIDYDTRPFNHSTNTLNAWHGEGTSNTIPISTFADNGSSQNSSIFVEDASYMRLKNVEIGYSFGNLLRKKSTAGIQDVRVYLSMQNLFTITNYTGLDPESTLLIDKGTYPQSQAFIFGVNVKL